MLSKEEKELIDLLHYARYYLNEVAVHMRHIYGDEFAHAEQASGAADIILTWVEGIKQEAGND